MNLVRGTEQSWLAWNEEALDPMVDAAVLRYLAVAHYGRGRGEWAEGESPAHWPAVVAQALAPLRADLSALWAQRDDPHEAEDAAARLADALTPLLRRATARTLQALYPGAASDAALKDIA